MSICRLDSFSRFSMLRPCFYRLLRSLMRGKVASVPSRRSWSCRWLADVTYQFTWYPRFSCRRPSRTGPCRVYRVAASITEKKPYASRHSDSETRRLPVFLYFRLPIPSHHVHGLVYSRMFSNTSSHASHRLLEALPADFPERGPGSPIHPWPSSTATFPPSSFEAAGMQLR